MYTVYVDLEIRFTPPMNEDTPGLIMTKQIELPFVPVAGMNLIGKTIDPDPFPPGREIKGVTWDDDRRVFLIDLESTMVNFPLNRLPDQITYLEESGWRIGSWQDHFDQTTDATDQQAAVEAAGRKALTRKETRLFRGLVRLTAGANRSPAHAYATERSCEIIQDDDVDPNRQEVADTFKAAVREYDTMTNQQKQAWLRRVSKYPKLGAYFDLLPYDIKALGGSEEYRAK